MIAFLICCQVAFGYRCRYKAVIPATTGADVDVPPSRMCMQPNFAIFDGGVAGMLAITIGASVTVPDAVTSGFTHPSRVGPRLELAASSPGTPPVTVIKLSHDSYSLLLM